MGRDLLDDLVGVDVVEALLLHDLPAPLLDGVPPARLDELLPQRRSQPVNNDSFKVMDT